MCVCVCVCVRACVRLIVSAHVFLFIHVFLREPQTKQGPPYILMYMKNIQRLGHHHIYMVYAR